MATNPGQIVRDIITLNGSNIAATARAINMDRASLSEVTKGRYAVTRELAFKMGAYFGQDAADFIVKAIRALEDEQAGALLAKHRTKITPRDGFGTPFLPEGDDFYAPKAAPEASKALAAPVVATVAAPAPAPKKVAAPKKAPAPKKTAPAPKVEGIFLTTGRIGLTGPIYRGEFEDYSRAKGRKNLPFTLTTPRGTLPLLYWATQGADELGVVGVNRELLKTLQENDVAEGYAALEDVFLGMAGAFIVRGAIEIDSNELRTAHIDRIDFEEEADAFNLMLKFGGNVTENTSATAAKTPAPTRKGRVDPAHRVVTRWSRSNMTTAYFFRLSLPMELTTRYGGVEQMVKSHPLVDWVWKNTAHGDFEWREDTTERSSLCLHFDNIEDAALFADTFAHDGKTVDLSPLKERVARSAASKKAAADKASLSRADLPKRKRVVVRDDKVIADLTAAGWGRVDLPGMKRMTGGQNETFDTLHPLTGVKLDWTKYGYVTILQRSLRLDGLWQGTKEDFIIVAPEWQDKSHHHNGYGPTTVSDAFVMFKNPEDAERFGNYK